MTIAIAPAFSDRARRWRPVVAASLGNSLEWFDFVIFGFFATTIAKMFFPSQDEAVSLLLTFATFGVTFFVRPLGAVVLGVFADRHGRKAALTLAIALMMVGTAVIAAAPTYSVIGAFAPVLLVIARVIQGFSAGGEFGSATVFLAEQNPLRRGFFASWQFASQGLTTVLATAFGAGLSSALTLDQMEGWGWRIPFIFGLLIGPIAYYIRRNTDETPEFRSLTEKGAPLREALVQGRKRLLISLGVVVLCTVAMYTILFMPTYATRQLGLPATGSFVAILLTGAIQLVLTPVFGSLSDRRGRLPILFASAATILFSVYPMFIWLASSPTLQTLLIVQAIIGLLTASYLGPLPALMSEIFPTRMRTTGLSISYSFGVALFGGFAPFINAWLIESTGSSLAPSWYVMFAAMVSLAALGAARRLGVK